MVSSRLVVPKLAFWNGGGTAVTSSLAGSPELGVILFFQHGSVPISHSNLPFQFVPLFILSCHHGNTPNPLGLQRAVIWALSSRWANSRSKYLQVRKSQVPRTDILRIFSPSSLSPNLQFLGSLTSSVWAPQDSCSHFTPENYFSTWTPLYFCSLFFFLSCSLEYLFFLYWKSFKIFEFLLWEISLFIHNYLSVIDISTCNRTFRRGQYK